VVGRDAGGNCSEGVFCTNFTNGAYDPSILIDDDENETSYLTFGLHGSSDSSYGIAKLTANLQSFAEQPKPIVFLPNLADGTTMPSGDKSTIHKRGETYYLSSGSACVSFALFNFIVRVYSCTVQLSYIPDLRLNV
jgi:beta-xylosidase